MSKGCKNCRTPRRNGLSFVEFMGCMVAMVGGVLIGSFYLGVDVQQVTAAVLEQAQVVAPGYFRQAESAATDSDVQLATELEYQQPPANDSGELTGEGVSESTTPSEAGLRPNSNSTKKIAQSGPSDDERRAATRIYWEQLTANMLEEAQGRLNGEGNPAEWEMYDYLLQRKHGHEAALVKLETLQTTGVDERLLGHGEQVIAWHKSGISLFEHALSLLSDGPGAELSGPFAQSWQTAATQLRMEENLVIERHRAVANYLDREYPTEAPFVPAYQQR